MAANESYYTKDMLDEHFKDLKESVSGVSKGIEALNVKVGIQNGRIGKLEGKFNAVALAGSSAVVLVGIIISLVVYSFTISQENLKNSILLEVSQTL